MNSISSLHCFHSAADLHGGSHFFSLSRRTRRYFLILLSAAMLFAASVGAVSAGRITDMAGRNVTVPAKIRKVWSAYPPLTYLIYALDPTLLNGWNYPLETRSRPYIASRYRDLPIMGGWFGQKTPNIEAIALDRPGVALVWDESLQAQPVMEKRLRALSIPVVAVKLDRIADYPDTVLFLGKLLDRRVRAAELARSISATVREMRAFAASIPPSSRRSVYYATGPDGLTNDCNHMPFLEESIELAGGKCVQNCEQQNEFGSKIGLELVMAYNPDVIITQDDRFYRSVLTDRRWQTIRAVRERRVYRIPSLPFNWLNYPPSFMRALGIKWLASVVYPERFRHDMKKEVKSFYRQFLNLDLNRGQIDAVLSP